MNKHIKHPSNIIQYDKEGNIRYISPTVIGKSVIRYLHGKPKENYTIVGILRDWFLLVAEDGRVFATNPGVCKFIEEKENE